MLFPRLLLPTSRETIFIAAAILISRMAARPGRQSSPPAHVFPPHVPTRASARMPSSRRHAVVSARPFGRAGSMPDFFRGVPLQDEEQALDGAG